MSPAMLSRVLQTLRESRGLSQRALAEKVGVTPGYIAQLEMGQKKNPSPDVLKRLARALGVSAMEIQPPKVDEATIRLLMRSVTLDHALAFVMSLERCVSDRETGIRSLPPGGKLSAEIALRKAMAAHPEKKARLVWLRDQLDELYGR